MSGTFMDWAGADTGAPMSRAARARRFMASSSLAARPQDTDAA